MSIKVTRTIQVVCVVLVALSLIGMLYSGGDPRLIGRAGETIGFSVAIFVLTTILRVVSDVGEKLLLAAGYRKPYEKNDGVAAMTPRNPSLDVNG